MQTFVSVLHGWSWIPEATCPHMRACFQHLTKIYCTSWNSSLRMETWPMPLQETENLKITGREEGAETKKRFYNQVLLNWTFIVGQRCWGNIHQVASRPWLGWVTIPCFHWCFPAWMRSLNWSPAIRASGHRPQTTLNFSRFPWKRFWSSSFWTRADLAWG